MNPSLRAIDQAIESLKKAPGTFQRLIEGYARIAYPGLFRRLDPGGRRSDDVTRKGWPDATAELVEGTTAILEATHSESWDGHLEDDIQKAEALGTGAIGAFLFAAWARSPKSEKIDPFRQRLLALAIPRDRILFLFQDQLVTELSRPLFACLWADPLGLPVSCLPFDVVDKVPRLFGPEERPDAFAPRRSEYQAGTVYRPRLAGVMEERLAQSGWALIRGRGAAGKTTLALCIAFGANYRGRPVYYLDLADLEGDEAEQADAIEAMATRGDVGILFLIDNVHLAPAAASRLFEAWRELAGNGSRLLLLGRLVTSEPDVRGRAHPLEDLDREALELAIDGEALIGVFRRIGARYAGPQEILSPPPSFTERWLRLFGGDLIAFSSAVSLRARGLLRGDWELGPEDAQRYIEREYLQNLSPTEREGVISLATLATLELAIPDELVRPAFSSSLLDQGWIIRSEHGLNRYVRFRFVHPGLGDLILSALSSVDRLRKLCAIAAANSYTGISVARRLTVQRLDSEVRAVLAAIATSLHWFSLSFGVARLPSTVRLFEKYAVLTSTEIDERLSQEEYQKSLLGDALVTPLQALGSSLRFAKGSLPGVYDLLRGSLGEEKHQKIIMETVLRTEWGSLGSFLSFVRVEIPEFYTFVTQCMQEEKNQKILAETVLRTPLSNLVSFLRFANGELPVVYRWLVQVLGEEKNHKVLAETALRTPLQFVRFFHNFARVHLPSVDDSLVQSLGDEENRIELLETALKRTSLGNLTSFLGFAKVDLPGVYRSLMQALVDEGSQKILAETALKAPPGDLASFLGFAKVDLPGVYNILMQALADEGNQKMLAERALRTPPGQLASFLGFAKVDLPEVYRSLVQALVTESSQKFLVEIALRTPLVQLAPFLSFAKAELPVVFNVVGEALEGSPEVLVETAMRTPLENLSSSLSFAKAELPVVFNVVEEALEGSPEVLVETAMRTPLEHLSSFLSFAKTELPAVYNSVARALEKNHKVLSETALRTPLEHLSSFLSFARDNLPGVYKWLVQVLGEERNQKILADLVTRSSLNTFGAFLKLEELAPMVIEAIDLERWREWRLQYPGEGAEALPFIVRQLMKYERSDLAIAPAQGAILAADVAEWHRPHVSLSAFSHAIRLAGDLNPEDLDRFLDLVALPWWLKSRYVWMTAGLLSGALFALWQLLDSARLKRFQSPELLRIIEQKANSWSAVETTASADLVSLIGIGALLGIRPSPAALFWASDTVLRSALEERAPNEDSPVLGPLQAQLWLGLRVIAARRRKPVRVTKAEGERILQLWREAEPENAKLQRLNRWMIAWLERCSTGSWRLLPDDTPLA